jgi:hypothetical protein
MSVGMKLLLPALAPSLAALVLATPVAADDEVIATAPAQASARPGVDDALAAEEDVRVIISAFRSGRANYADMTPALAEGVAKQLPSLKTTLSGLGTVEEVRYLGHAKGPHQFRVDFQNGSGTWFIARGADGKLATLVFRRIETD